MIVLLQQFRFGTSGFDDDYIGRILTRATLLAHRLHRY
jgi:hypothetical protein